VTAWFEVHSAPADEIAVMTGCRKKRNQREVRCRLTPIRPATDSEIERLAKALYRASSQGPIQNWGAWLAAPSSVRNVWRDVARAAWRKGARP